MRWRSASVVLIGLLVGSAGLLADAHRQIDFWETNIIEAVAKGVELRIGEIEKRHKAELEQLETKWSARNQETAQWWSSRAAPREALFEESKADARALNAKIAPTP